MIRSGEHAVWDAAMGEVRWAWIWNTAASYPTSGDVLAALDRAWRERIARRQEAFYRALMGFS